MGFTDRARVDDMTDRTVRRTERAMVRDVRMTAQEDIGACCFEDALEALITAIGKEVLVDAARAPVHQESAVDATATEPILDGDMRRESSEVGAIGIGDRCVGVRDRLFTELAFVLRFVRAAAVVTCRADANVIVASDRRDAVGADTFDNLVRPDVVADQVTQAVDGIRTLALNIGQTCFERGQVGVNIADDRYAHPLASNGEGNSAAIGMEPVCATGQKRHAWVAVRPCVEWKVGEHPPIAGVDRCNGRLAGFDDEIVAACWLGIDLRARRLGGLRDA